MEKTRQEEIRDQWILLKSHRNRLNTFLYRRSIQGNAYIPPEVSFGIYEARNDIKRVKTILRDWGESVKDHPDDEDEIVNSPTSQTYSTRTIEALDSDQSDDGFTIISTSAVLGSIMGDLEKSLGQPIRKTPRSIGGAEELPNGGESRAYTLKGYELTINYDKSDVARGLQIVDGLTSNNYSLEHWALIFSRIGITVTKQPDITASAARHWNNYLGYKLSIVADKPNGVVWTVRVYQLPNP